MRRHRPPYAERIRTERERSGVAVEMIVRRLGINRNWYSDIEEEDDEVVMTLSLAQVALLSDLLGVRADELLYAECVFPRAQGPIAFPELVARIKDHLASTGQDVAEFESMIGWLVGPSLENPERLWTWNADGLHDLCTALGLCWLDALPQAPPPPHVPLFPEPA